MACEHHDIGDFARKRDARGPNAERNTLDLTDLHFRARGKRGVTLCMGRSAPGDFLKSKPFVRSPDRLIQSPRSLELKQYLCLIGTMLAVSATPALASDVRPLAPTAPAAAERSADHHVVIGAGPAGSRPAARSVRGPQARSQAADDGRPECSQRSMLGLLREGCQSHTPIPSAKCARPTASNASIVQSSLMGAARFGPPPTGPRRFHDANLGGTGNSSLEQVG